MKRVIYFLSAAVLMTGLGIWGVGCGEQSKSSGPNTWAKSETKTNPKDKKSSPKKSCIFCPGSNGCR